jgi:hypothetical protein
LPCRFEAHHTGYSLYVIVAPSFITSFVIAVMYCHLVSSINAAIITAGILLPPAFIIAIIYRRHL